MIPSIKIFENMFDDIRITPFRLSNFSTDCSARFENIDTDGVFKVSTEAILVAHNPFHSGLNVIDTALGIKKGKTKNVNEVKTAFGTYMSEYEGEISRKLGGRDTATFAAFYPHGIMEYSNATKAQMPLLVSRIDTLATSNATALGETITLQLQSFMVLWQAARTDESAVKSDLSDGRADRGTLRTNLEMALLTAIHLVAAKYPGDVAKCTSFFDFGLLTKGSRKAAVAVVPPAV